MFQNGLKKGNITRTLCQKREHCRRGAGYSENITNSVGRVPRYAMRNATQGLVSVYAVTRCYGRCAARLRNWYRGHFSIGEKKAPPERGKLGELLRELSVFNDSFLHLAEGRVNFFVIGLAERLL